MAADDPPYVHPAHAAQLAAWDGDEGAYWASHCETFEKSLAAYDGRFMAAAELGTQSLVLDVGCGTGRSTVEAAKAAGDGSALGVDLSSAMLRVARERAEREGVANARFLQADAQVHPFAAGTFDAAIARTSAMFFADKAAALTNIALALRPGGRLALLVWQPPSANEWITEIATAMAAGRERPAPPPDGPQPFSLSDPGRTHHWLAVSGFGGIEIEGLAAPMWFGDGPEDAFPFVLGQVGWMLDGLDDGGRRRALADLRARIEAHVGPDGVTFGSACWLVTADRLP